MFRRIRGHLGHIIGHLLRHILVKFPVQFGHLEHLLGHLEHPFMHFSGGHHLGILLVCKELYAPNKDNHQREERQTATSLRQRPLDSLPGFAGINKDQLEGMKW